MAPIIILGLVTALGAAIRGNWSPCGESLQAQIHPLGERSRGNVWGVTGRIHDRLDGGGCSPHISPRLYR